MASLADQAAAGTLEVEVQVTAPIADALLIGTSTTARSPARWSAR